MPSPPTLRVRVDRKPCRGIYYNATEYVFFKQTIFPAGDLYVEGSRYLDLENQPGVFSAYSRQRARRNDDPLHVVKRDRYQRASIEYWIVDLDLRVVERWMPGDERPTIHDA